MKYFITGATGFVGSHIAKKLGEKDHELNAIVRSPDKATYLKNMGITIFKGDITDKECMRAAMQGCDGVFHVAGWYKLGSKDKTTGQKVNVEGTRNVLELVQELDVQKGVYTSTLAVNSDTHGNVYDETFRYSGEHISEYDRTKAKAHDIADRFIQNHLPLVIVMPGLIYGPDGTSLSDKALRLYLQKKLPVIPKGSAYCWAHVDDIAEGHILAMNKAKPGSTYIIAGPKHTLTEAFELAEKITGIRKPVTVPPVLLRMMSFFSAMIEKVISMPEMYSSEALRVQAGVTYLGDNSKARDELGYNPRPLEEGLQQTLEYEQEKLNKSS